MSTNAFYEHPILNSPHEYPRRHWELDKDGQPTQKLLEMRGPAGSTAQCSCREFFKQSGIGA